MITWKNLSRSHFRLSPPLVALVLLSSCAPALAQEEPRPALAQGETSPWLAQVEVEKGSIQVTGQAQVAVPADRAKITFIVETEAEAAADATQENAVKMEAVTAALRGSGVDDLDIETFGYSLRPEYEVARDGSGTRVISGYRVQNNIRVTIPDVDATGRLLDLAVQAGANRIANLSFEASDTRGARLQALREAVSNAREQAEVIASAMQVELGIALEVQGGANAPSPSSFQGMPMRMAAESVTPVESADQLVTASVTIRYRILEVGS